MTPATIEKTDATPKTDWESKISQLLSGLSQVQGDLLALLAEKREALAAGEYQRLQEFASREKELVGRLEQCHAERQQLLDAAAAEKLPAGSVRSLAASLPAEPRKALKPTVEQARRQSRLLQHQSLTNWVLVQRTLIHLSQMIEIIATGGRAKDTYGGASASSQSGALVDREV